jgi:Ca-activated chloride channel homolog
MKNTLRNLLFFLLVIYFSSCDEYSEPGTYAYIESVEEGSGENYQAYAENSFINVNEQPVSTFSIDADGGSYSNMRRFANLGQKPPKYSVRIEEYLNYFTFDYSEPESDENVSIESEIASCPWNENHHLIRIGLKGKTIPEEELVGSNYVFLIDVSGSMDSPDKLGILKQGFIRMTDNLRPDDRVAIVTYSGREKVVLESTFADDKTKIKFAILSLSASGSTAGAQGIQKAYEIAEQNFIPSGNNRVIIGTDGDFNVGISDTEELKRFIAEKRETGVYLTVLGVGTGNLNDHMMEQIANTGNGSYEYIDNACQIEKVFVHERSKFYTVAKDCKVKVNFNPDLVESYRLIGYENRLMSEDAFNNDSTDAGEIGSSQTITGLYEVVLRAHNAQDDYIRIDIRYKKPNENDSRLLKKKLIMMPQNINSASESMRFAASVAGYGLLMRESEYSGEANKQSILDLCKGALTYDPYRYCEEFVNLVKDLNF